MRHFDASSAECFVFTSKEGLLATVAHDLKIRVTKFHIDIDEDRHAIQARFDAASLRTVCATRDGVDAPGTLSASDKREIDQNISRDVLDAGAYPEITFTSSSVQQNGGRYLVKGALALHGRKRQVTVHVSKARTWFVGEARIHQPDFGIRPYSALLGTLKVKADVTVRISVPADAT
ncbi:MAG: YceI family protein [Candidatus Binatia bacterium]